MGNRWIEVDQFGNRYIVDDGSDVNSDGGANEIAQKLTADPYANKLGPNYNRTWAGNAIEGVVEAPQAAWQMAKDVGGFVADPVGTISNAGVEKTARTVGGLASGTAGAMAGAPLGAGWGAALGTPFGPIGMGIGGAAGGILGGAAGFGAGLLGFDLANDAAGSLVTGENRFRPVGQYAKDFVYNTAQGVPFGAVGQAVKTIPTVKKIYEPFTAKGVDARVVETLDQTQPGWREKIDPAAAANAGDPFAPFKSLGELIGSDPLKMAERALARGGGSLSAKANEARVARNAAQLKELNKIETSDMTPADVQAAISEGINQRQAASQRGISEAQDAVTSALEQLPEGAPVDALGSNIRSAVEGSRDALRGKMTAAFEGIGDGVVDMTTPQTLIAEKMPNYFREMGPQPNERLTGLVKSLTKEGEPIMAGDQPMLGPDGQPLVRPVVYTMKDLQALRSQALDIAQSGDRRSASIAGQIADALEKAGEEAVQAGTVSPEAAKNWKTAVSLRKKEGVLYDSSATPAKKVLAEQKFGEPKLPPSAVPDLYFRPGNGAMGARGIKEGIQNYKQTVGASEQALDPLYKYAAESFRRSAVKNGVVDSKAAGRWLDRYSAALDELPELKSLLSNVHERQRFLNEKFGDLKVSEAEMGKGLLKEFLGADPEKAISTMLSGNDLAKKTVRMVQYLKANDPDALIGLRRGVIEHLESKAFRPGPGATLEEARLPSGQPFDGTVMGATLLKEWLRIKPAMERSKLFTESQMKGFEQLYKEKASQLSVENAKAPGGSDTAQNNSTLNAIIKVSGQGFLRRMPYGRWLSAVEPIIRAIPREKYLARLQEALMDPRIARDLQNKATVKNVTRGFAAVFKEEFNTALGATKAAAINAPVVESQKKQAPPRVDRVTSGQTFPNPKSLLNPPSEGALKRSSFDVKSFMANQSPDMQAIVSVESSGNPDAISPKGAVGLAQLTPIAAAEVSKDLGEPYMPIRKGMSEAERQAAIEQNVRFGEHYFKKQLGKYGNRTLAWAAYNAGPRRVEEAMAKAGTRTDVAKILSSLPMGVQRETVPYIAKLLEKYG